MLISLLSPVSVLCAGVVVFLFGWLWYSPALFMKPWLDGMNMKKGDMPKRSNFYMWHCMAYQFAVSLLMVTVLAFFIDIAQLTSLYQALAFAELLALGIIGLKNFSDMLYTMPETFWSFRAQKKFLVDTGFYVAMFAIAVLVMYYVSGSTLVSQ